MSADEKNKKPKKPVAKKDEDFIEEDDNNKSLILLAIGIVIVIGLMVGVITYLNKGETPKNDKDNDGNKQNEVVNPDKDEDDDKQEEKDAQEQENTDTVVLDSEPTSSSSVAQQSAPVVTTKYTVNYYHGQDIVNSLTVESGKNIPYLDLTLSSNQKLKYWYYLNANNEEVPFDFSSNTVTSDLELYPKIVDLFTVEFIDTGSNEITDSQTVENGAKLGALKEEDLTWVSGGGYQKVVGWYKEAALTNEFDLSTPITSDLTLYAKISDAYKVEFYLEERTDYKNYAGTIYDEIIEKNGKVTEQKGLKSDGKVLKEWHKLTLAANPDDPYTTALFDFNTQITENIVLIPIFGYTLTYNTDGGSTIEEVVIEEGEKLVEPANPTKEGYQFNKWVYAKDESDVDFADDTMDDHTTIKAVWDIVVTFDTGDATTKFTKVVGQGEKLTETITDPTKAGYTFAGWYTDATFTTSAGDLTSAVFDKPTVLYAKWTANENTITYYLNGGTNTVNAGVNVTQTATTDSKVTLTDLTGTYTYTGYVLLGYSTDENGTVEYQLGQEITMGTSDMTLFAVWGELHTLTVDYNGGTGSDGTSTSATKEVLEGDKILDDIESISSSVTAPDGMQLSGYNTQSDGLGTAIDANSVMPDSDQTVYMIWESATP